MTEDLDARIRRILGRLEALPGSVSAVAFDGKISQSKPGDRPPPGALPGRDPDACPPKERSLFEFYRWQFDRARDTSRRLLLCYMAERDYHIATHGSGAHRIAGRPERTNESQFAAFIVDTYEGVDWREVAVLEDISSPGWVRRVREDADRDPERGHHRPNFRRLDAEGRRDLLAACQAEGWSQREAASYLGVSRTTVARFWPPCMSDT